MHFSSSQTLIDSVECKATLSQVKNLSNRGVEIVRHYLLPIGVMMPADRLGPPSISLPRFRVRAPHSTVDQLDVTGLHRLGQHCVGKDLSTHSARSESRFQALRRRFSVPEKLTHPGHCGIAYFQVYGGSGAFRTAFVRLVSGILPLGVAVIAFHHCHARDTSIH
jgi:hypothetical protein